MAGGSSPSSLRIRLLGGLSVDDVAERDLGSRKARTLLKALALARGRPVPTDQLVDRLWRDSPPARPNDQVGVLVSRLRGVLGADRLPRADAGYSVVADWFDIDELTARVDEAAAAVAAGRFAAARAAAAAALALVRGPLLADEDGDWVDTERDAVEAVVGRARRLLAEASAGDHDAAAVAAETALAHDPYDEVALQILMRAHTGAGRPASALAAYAKVRQRLVEDLGVSPTAATEALHGEILAGTDEPAGGTGGGAVGEPAIVGRSAELAVLDAALREASAGGPRLVLVEGEPGIGKTALVAAFASRATAGGAVVLRGRCDELGRDLPLEPVLDALATYRGGLGDDLASLAHGDVALTVADAELGRARFFGAVLGAVQDAGGDRPIVLTVDDLHHAGGSTLAWLAFARRRGHRLLIVATRRPGHGRLPGAEELALGPLAVEDVAALVGADRAAEIYERSGGNPLFATALASAGAGELPASVRDAADAVADGLGAVGALVRSAAVLGDEIDLDLLAEVLGAPAVELLGQLELAAGAGLLDEHGTGFAFRHPLVREALESSACAARRSLLHRQAARCLDARATVDPLAVAVHARLGGDDALAASDYVDAAATAAARFDIEAAEANLDASLALRETAGARTARARIRIVQQRLEAASDEAARAVALDGGAAALEVAGWVAYYRRRYGEARALADDAVAIATDPTVRVSCLALAGRVRHGAGDVHGADAQLASLDPAPYPVRGVADVWLAHLRNHQGRPAEALELLGRALVDPDRLAHPFGPLHGRFARVVALGHLGQVAAALRACDELDAAVVRAGAYGVRFPAIAANTRAWLLRSIGRYDEADERNQYAAECNGDATGNAPAGDAMAEGFWVARLDFVDGRLALGDLAGAAAALDRAAPIESWAGGMAWHQRHRLVLQRARLRLATGDAEGAAELAAEVTTDAVERGTRRYELLARAVVGLAGGETDLPRLDAVVEGLGGCAGLEGWRLMAGLADRYDVDRWRAEAGRRAAALVASCEEGDADSARAVVNAVLG